jgi:DNA-binding NarL/FixJ family response regulator
MSNPINVLIVDDHPFIIEAYKNALKKYAERGHEFNVAQANDCKSGYEAIANSKVVFDIAMFDINMPQYPEKGIFSGEDLAFFIKEQMPTSKIILLSMISETDKIKDIIATLNPNGLIVKNDITFDELIFAVDRILNDENYYTKTVVEIIGQENDFNGYPLDIFDKHILRLMSKKTPNSELVKYVPLTSTAIESKKNKIRDLLGVLDKDDDELIRRARSKGLL